MRNNHQANRVVGGRGSPGKGTSICQCTGERRWLGQREDPGEGLYPVELYESSFLLLDRSGWRTCAPRKYSSLDFFLSGKVTVLGSHLSPIARLLPSLLPRAKWRMPHPPAGFRAQRTYRKVSSFTTPAEKSSSCKRDPRLCLAFLWHLRSLLFALDMGPDLGTRRDLEEGHSPEP